MLGEGITITRVGDFALRGDSVDPGRVSAHPGFWSVAGLIFGAIIVGNVFGMLSTICPTAEEQQQSTRGRS
jgi:hypothetical protein